MDYINRLKQIREEKNLSLQEIAEKLSMEEGLLNMIENGEMLPTEDQEEAIMQFVLDQLG